MRRTSEASGMSGVRFILSEGFIQLLSKQTEHGSGIFHRALIRSARSEAAERGVLTELREALQDADVTLVTNLSRKEVVDRPVIVAPPDDIAKIAVASLDI